MERRRKPRAVRSCTECKQVKLRCDAKQTVPRPCTRCSTKNLECIVDAKFRRTPARQRLDELSREVKHLQRSLSHVTSQSMSGPPHPSQSQDTEAIRPSTSRDTEHTLDDAEQSQIGDCIFTRDELISIFSTFISYFYKHLPIIDLPISPRLLQQSSPFLFWTIVMIVVQRASSVYPRRSAALSRAYTPLLEKAILATPLTLPTIQALLFLCTWPLAVDYQARDQSWTLAGIIVNAALYSAIHKPTHPQSLRSVGVFIDSRLRSSLWLATFYISTSLSQSIGVPPSLNSLDHLSTIARMASDESIPRQLASLAEIQACAAKYISLVSESTESNLAVLLERTFEHELNLIKHRYTAGWNSDVEFAFLDSKLHLIATLAISQDKQLNPSNEGSAVSAIDPSLLASLSDGFTCATRMIQIICRSQDSSGASELLGAYTISSNELYMQGLPKLYFRALMFATFFLLRYHVPRRAILVTETNLAQDHVDMACNYLRSYSIRPDDEPGRAAAVIETLSTFSAALPTASMGPMRIKERLGASIFYDALTRASELRARPVQLFSDQEQPQQTLVVDTTLVNTADTDTPNTNPEESGNEKNPGDEGYLADLPEDWMEHLDFDMMELSGDLFTGATMFS